ncbi:LysM peptidoglycan-binding domain-containing protein [Crassaminicella thermophila]|uniref:LysM peptidoglycan-binding domain-containing protein n=1 Tax=Crassaminicella thermophila TaxID=2599308 RepID=A0A5C0SC47_CRATE|nr:LysM domain-containing protein [Crassaminicella thermophila]QEK12133.1 LysM peptidoglycan-binding domain-containing protein [Crassaminicella thermophila]
MKLTKREKVLSIFLSIILIGYVYVYFIIGPQMTKLKGLKKDIQTFQSQIEKSEKIVASKDRIEKEYNKLKGEVSLIEKKFFSSTEQENIIVLLNEMLKDSALKVSAIDFSELKTEDVKEYTLDVITVHLPFEGSYDALLDFIKKIREYEKKIIVNGLHIENSKDGNLSGSIYLDFYSLPDKANNDYMNEYFSNHESGKENPFIPFDGFIWSDDQLEDEYLTEDNGQAFIAEKKFVLNKVLLNGFEKLNTFFVGTPKKVYGKISRDIKSREGKYALKLEYDFLRPRENSQANVVYEGKKVLISKQAENIGIWVYAFEKSNHKIGITLKDSKGKIYTVLLTNQIDWVGWNNIEAVLPIEIAYPAEVQRIYVESVNFDNKTKGILLFDRLEVTYPSALIYNTNSSSNKQFTVNNTKDIEYKVQSGDTIFSIAKKFYNDYEKRELIKQYNNILDVKNISVGQILRIPKVNVNKDNSKSYEQTSKENNAEVIYYKVQPNDTIFSISKKFYGNYSKRNLIIEYNHIKDPTDIKVGQVIYIPKIQ